MWFSKYYTGLGDIYLEQKNNAISCLCFQRKESFIQENCNETPLLKQAFYQINEYLNGNRKFFNLPLSLNGTSFQKNVWKELCNIPYGETVSYKFIAEKISKPLAYRAVGMANHKNPIPIIIPCHRVIGSGGKLVGYAGGLDIKTKLLNIEACYK